jgi:hypothetical protein
MRAFISRYNITGGMPHLGKNPLNNISQRDYSTACCIRCFIGFAPYRGVHQIMIHIADPNYAISRARKRKDHYAPRSRRLLICRAVYFQYLC